MPCRSDYMEPSPKEKQVANEGNVAFRALADRATYANDVLREYLIHSFQPGDGYPTNFLKFVNLDLHSEWEALRKKFHKNLYVKVDEGLVDHAKGLVEAYHWLNDIVVSGEPLTNPEKAKILGDQEEHREADLARLMKVFAASGDRKRLRAVLDADATRPLDPQLGFSPDAF